MTEIIAAARVAWAFLTSPLGRALAAAAGVILLLWTAYHWAEQRGDRAGAARVQATIDKPVTGWRARLEQCSRNTETLQGKLDEQSAKVKANGAADAAALAKAKSDLTKAQDATRDAEHMRGVIRQPLPASVPVAATQGSTCPVDALTAARLREIDRRLTQ